MSIVCIALNLLLATLLTAALGMGWRLNRRLIILRESHEGFAKAVGELDMAAQRAEQGLADLRAATDEATDLLADRIEKARELTQKLERLTSQAASAAPAPAAPVRAREPAAELELRQPLDARRLGALLGAAREVRQRPAPTPAPAPAPRREPAPPPTRLRAPEDDLFEEPPVRRPISAMGGGFR
jgi:hypothetical protein